MYQLLKTEARGSRDQMPPHRMRKEGWIPGVIYGKGIESVTFRIPAKEWKRFYTSAHSKVFEVEVPGNGRHLVSLENVQKNHLGNQIMHLEFHHLDQKQVTVITLPIKLVGEAIGLKGGGVVSIDHHEVDVKGLPGDFVEYIEVNVSNLDVHESIHLSDITPPKGLSFVDGGDTVIAHCAIPKMKVEADTTAVEPELVGESQNADEDKQAS
jgi:large subunit ribosomal protein L25